MDYVVGGIAALLTGNVTPNRPKPARRALTPTKHQRSPNVTPKSEFVDDRSIFMSPTMQKKKAVLKKSPKRIFQNPDLDEMNDGEGTSVLTSPKAEKVKKHLKSKLESENIANNSPTSPKTGKLTKSQLEKVTESPVHKKKSRTSSTGHEEIDLQSATENTPKKKKKNRSLSTDFNEIVSDKENALKTPSFVAEAKSTKKKRKLALETDETANNMTKEPSDTNTEIKASPKKKKKKQEAKVDIKKTTEGTDELKIKKYNSKSQKRRERKKRTHLKKIKQQLRNLTDSEKALNKAKKHIVDEEKEINSHKPKSNQSVSESDQDSDSNDSDEESEKEQNILKTKKNEPTITSDAELESGSENEPTTIKQKKKKKSKFTKQIGNQNFNFDSDTNSKMEEETLSISRKKKLHKKLPINNQDSDSDSDSNSKTEQVKSDKKKKKSKVNPNAITDQNSDSEHESDDEIESENEQINKDLLKTDPTEGGSSSDEEKAEKEQQQPTKKTKKEAEGAEDDVEVIKRTLFVGNVPFSKKCKKEIKSIFSKYGHIDTVRIRTVPVKDARVTPKLAVIRNELHPDRSTVNVYVKFSDSAAVDKALLANNTVLNEHHLRVTRADHTGALDSSCSVFVGNLPFAMEDDGLRKVFDKCGHIESVRIVRDRATNAGKGFGYVNFTSKDGVELALSMSEEDLTVKNRIIRVKRCTQTAQKGRHQGKQGNERSQGTVQGKNPGGNFRDRNQNDNFRGGKFQGRNQGGKFQGRNQGGNFQGRNQGITNRFQGKNQGPGNQRAKGRGQGDRQRQDDEQGDGAYRRIMKKRGNQDVAEGPPTKAAKSDSDQIVKEKKQRKEFVGMTAEKKKKHKINKGLKKNKALSEILTKQ